MNLGAQNFSEEPEPPQEQEVSSVFKSTRLFVDQTTFKAFKLFMVANLRFQLSCYTLNYLLNLLYAAQQFLQKLTPFIYLFVPFLKENYSVKTGWLCSLNTSQLQHNIFTCTTLANFSLNVVCFSMTGREFFSRFPELHSFFLRHLEVACRGIERFDFP